MSPGAHDVLGEGDPINSKCVHCAMACVCCAANCIATHAATKSKKCVTRSRGIVIHVGEVSMVCINFVGSQSQSKWKGECACMLYVHIHTHTHTHTRMHVYAYCLYYLCCPTSSYEGGESGVMPILDLCQLAELVWLQSDCSIRVQVV